MRIFDLNELTQELVGLMETLEWCARRRVLDSADEGLTPADWKGIYNSFAALEKVTSSAEFPTAFNVVGALNVRLDPNQPPNFFQLETDIQHVKDSILADVERCVFLRVPQKLRSLVDNDTPFGTLVAAAFPSATTDLREACNCLAADCNTAAVFHSMRAVEWALRALGAHLGFRQLRARKKSGKRKHVPISHLEWEKIIDQLQVRVDRQIERMRPGKRKQSLQEFYYPALQDTRAIRDAWRNHVMHGRSEYTADDAYAVMAHVERLMTSLATRVSEV
jgi:hypothetical protein